MHCEDCALSEGLIRVREDLTDEVKSDRLKLQRGKAQVEVFPGEIRHLVTALGSLHHELQWQADEGPSYPRTV